MLEWLLRKIFGIKRPESKKQRATRELELEEIARREAKDREGMAATSKAEPSVDMANVQPLVPRSGTHEVSVPLTGGEQTGESPSPAAEQLSADEKEAKVHIFNFRAWFYADPVKAALTLGLAFLSWLATYTGMLELIQANTGSLDIGSRVAIAFAVMMLMLMILYLLDSLYSGGTPTWIKPLFVFGYLFLTLISVGFGFGFYWKYLEAQTEATRSAESAVSQVQVALQIGQSRLEQLQGTFAQLTTLSTKKKEQERDHGNSCPNSSPGEGPRMRLRDADSQNFGYAAEYITGRASSVKKDLTALNVDLKKVVSRDGSTVGADGTRNKFLRALGRKLDLTIARFNTLRTDPQLRQFRDNFDKRASTTVFPNGRGGTFRCPDVQLKTALRGVVRAIDDIPEIKNPKIAAVEGSEAIVEAFRRLAVTLAALPTLKLPPSPEELRKARKQAISAGRKVEVSNIDAGLSKRDYIPLSAAVFVDLCILLISLNRRYNNFEKLQRSVASARAGEIGNTVLDIFEAHKNKISQEMLEIFHHAEFEYGRDYYLAVPLIKGSKKALINERLHAKQDEISRSKHEALDHKIGTLDTKLQKLLKEQGELDEMKNIFLSSQSQLHANRKQLHLACRGEAPEATRQRPEIVGNEGQIALMTEKLTKLDRVMNGNFQRIEQTKNEIGQVKEQRTAVHERDELVLKGQLESSAEHDLAKEARFLSNLCVSLEANNILHLASIYPFQAQVRAQLKKHSSRYFAKDRHYRVYRFRKVADTQSQMVLDLIMEASKRARDNGELVEAEVRGAADGVAGTATAGQNPQPATEEAVADAELSAEKNARNAEIEDLRQVVLDIQKERDKERVEFETLKKEKASEPRPPIDKDATVIETEPVRQLSDSERNSMNKALRKMTVKGNDGLGVSREDLADLGKKDQGESADPTHDEQTTVVTAQLTDEERSPRGMAKILGGIFSSGSASAKGEAPEPKARQATPDTAQSAPEKQETAPKEAKETKELKDQETKDEQSVRPAKISDRLASLDTSETIQDQSSESRAEKSTEMEREPFVAIRPETTPVEPEARGRAPEARGQVNEDSLLPQAPETPARTVTAPASPDDPSITARLSEDDHVKRGQSLSHLSEVKQSLQSRVKKLGDADGTHVTNKDATTVSALTDPVVLPPGDSSQDPTDRLRADQETHQWATRDEPSEADQFQEGALPGFLRGEEGLDEASEQISIESMAKKFSPKKKDK